MSNPIQIDYFTNRLINYFDTGETVLFLLKNNKIPIYEMLLYAGIVSRKILIVDYLLNNGCNFDNDSLNLIAARYVLMFSQDPKLLILLLKH